MKSFKHFQCWTAALPSCWVGGLKWWRIFNRLWIPEKNREDLFLNFLHLKQWNKPFILSHWKVLRESGVRWGLFCSAPASVFINSYAPEFQLWDFSIFLCHPQWQTPPWLRVGSRTQVGSMAFPQWQQFSALQ